MRTTLNLKSKDIVEVQKISKEYGVNQEEIIKYVLNVIVDQKPMLENFSGGLCYQEDDPTYECFHITFSQNDYERNFDLKKIYKCSLSLIVSFALALFLDLFIHERTKKPSNALSAKREDRSLDSYPNIDYVYVSYECENEKFFGINWIKQRK